MNLNGFCRELSPFLHLVGEGIVIFELAIPLILIVIGIIDISRAVVSKKSEDVKKNLLSFGIKVVFSILIYFVPLFIMVLYNLVGTFTTSVEASGIDFEVCYDCLFNPSSEVCNDAVTENKWK